MTRYLLCLFICLVGLSMPSCQCGKTKKKVKAIEVTAAIEVQRLDQAIHGLEAEQLNQQMLQLRTQYGSFIDFYAYRLMQLAPQGDSDSLLNDGFWRFSQDSTIRKVQDTIDLNYEDIDDIEEELSQAFSRLQLEFPEAPIPQVVFAQSGFQYGCFTYGPELLAIAPEFYLGDQFKSYQHIFPEYIIPRLQREYLVPSAVKAYVGELQQKDYHENNALVYEMIEAGKVLAFAAALLPNAEAHTIANYTPAQLAWCEASELSVWQFLNDQKVLFERDQENYRRFLRDGPFTSGMPKDAPANIGAWVGWQIVDSYLQRQSSVSLMDMLNTDPQKLLQQSGYRPK